jgi:hypothetical protein
MGLTFLQMQHEIIGRIHEQHAAAAAIRTRVKQWINLARDQFVGYGPWHFLGTSETVGLVGSQLEYSLNSAMMAMNNEKVFLDTTKTKLHYLTEQDFELLVTDRTAEGTPAYFTLMGYQKIQLYPIPDASAVTAETNFEYEYFARLSTALSGDSDTSGLPEYVEPIIMDMAETYAQQYAKNIQEAAQAFGRVMPALQSLWMKNSEILGLGARDIPPALNLSKFEQLTRVDRSQ